MRWALPLILLAGCNQSAAIAPGKIVSNNPCIDAILAEIADPDQIGAVSLWSHQPQSSSVSLAWSRRFPAIGASAEEVIAAKPVLALTGALATSGGQSPVSRAGIAEMTIGVPATIAESKAQIMQIANAIGRRAEGADLVARIDTATKAVPKHKTAIIWQASGFVPGRGTIQDEMLGRAGYINASQLYGLKQWDMLPLETLVRNPPDIIFSPDRADGEDARSLAARQQVLMRLKGRTKVVTFPDRLLFCAGPGMIETMRVLKAQLPSRLREESRVGESQLQLSARARPLPAPPASGWGV